jgi:hypothetical protein
VAIPAFVGRTIGAVLGLAITLLFLVFNPIVVGLIGYSTGRLWPATVCLGALLLYTLLAVPLVLDAPPPSYCHGQPDCPDPDTRGFVFVMGFVWLIADCIAAAVGGIYGDKSARAAEPDLPVRLFVGRARRPLPPRR